MGYPPYRSSARLMALVVGPHENDRQIDASHAEGRNTVVPWRITRHVPVSYCYDTHRMLSYGALLENSTGQNFFQYHPRHTVVCTCIDTHFAVQTAKIRATITVGAATTSYRCNHADSPVNDGPWQPRLHLPVYTHDMSLPVRVLEGFHEICI